MAKNTENGFSFWANRSLCLNMRVPVPAICMSHETCHLHGFFRSLSLLKLTSFFSLNYCRAVRFCATSIARPFASILRSGSLSHQCIFFGSFLGKPALQRFPIWINGLCSTDLGQSFGHLTNCGSIFFMLMIHLKTRNFQNFRSFGPCTGTISIDSSRPFELTAERSFEFRISSHDSCGGRLLGKQT